MRFALLGGLDVPQAVQYLENFVASRPSIGRRGETSTSVARSPQIPEVHLVFWVFNTNFLPLRFEALSFRACLLTGLPRHHFLGILVADYAQQDAYLLVFLVYGFFKFLGEVFQGLFQVFDLILGFLPRKTSFVRTEDAGLYLGRAVCGADPLKVFWGLHLGFEEAFWTSGGLV